MMTFIRLTITAVSTEGEKATIEERLRAELYSYVQKGRES